MSEQLTIGGAIENGRRGLASFTFYQGTVGIRERDGWMEVAFFSPPLRLKELPLPGTIDGGKVRVIEVRARDFNADLPAKPNDMTPRVIVAIVVPDTEGE